MMKANVASFWSQFLKVMGHLRRTAGMLAIDEALQEGNLENKS